MDDRTAAVPFRAAHRRRAAAALAGLMLAVGALAACAEGAPTASSPGSPSGSASPASTGPTAPASPSASASAAPSTDPRPSTAPPSAPASPPGPGIAVGEPDPTAPRFPATGYRVDGGTKLVVTFYGGICDRYGLKAEEATPGVIRVRVVVTEPAPKGQACAALAKPTEVSAQLDKPFHGEAVLDLATGEQVQPNGDPAGGPR
ncbi:hypothetical protein OG871_11780 [Kitasatospora sp. NBC_00374]|uniref:hypothetical protein n=1 Tax=Kitasatospora sp. NBC_00374 TaxID=2975964 RepID=UPI00324C0C47